eukprot:jgi/Bigna1/136739/aug1.35_g11447
MRKREAFVEKTTKKLARKSAQRREERERNLKTTLISGTKRIKQLHIVRKTTVVNGRPQTTKRVIASSSSTGKRKAAPQGAGAKLFAKFRRR